MRREDWLVLHEFRTNESEGDEMDWLVLLHRAAGTVAGFWD